MCDKTEFELCRLCLNSCGQLINIFDEDSKLEFMLEKTIEDLIDVKVVEDANYPWLVCSTCLEKLTEFRLFKRRCAECLFVFYNRIQKGCNPTTEDRITNREELPSGIKKECCDDPIASEAVDRTAVDVRDDMIVVKKEVDTASECSASPGRDIDSSLVPSMQEGCSHWSDSEEVGNMGPLEDRELRLSFNEEVDIKEECQDDIPQEEGCLRADLSQEQDGVQGQDGTGKDAEGGNPLQMCQISNEVFAKRDILRAHLMRDRVADGKQFGCDVCSEVFEFKSDLDGHVASVHAVKKKHRCQYCSKQFQYPSELRVHILTHTGEREFECASCLKGFAHRGDLRRHMLTHTGAKPNKCEICAKSFSVKANLRRHLMIHNGLKQYKCDVCAKAFSQSGDLKRHASTHSGEKHHKCEICSKAFSLKKSLKTHLRIHAQAREKPHECPICSKRFNRKYQLEIHTLTHSGERRHTCSICSKTFKHKSVLIRHHSKVHAQIMND